MKNDEPMSEFLRTRVSETTKRDFEDICQTLGKTSTEQIRELVEAFVRREFGILSDRVSVHIYQPQRYGDGAWRIIIKLRNPAEMMWGGAVIPFNLPELKKRRLISDPEYLAVVTKQDGQPDLGGKFDRGEWRGHVYSNGCPESENPTSIEEVRTALHDTIVSIIQRFPH